MNASGPKTAFRGHTRISQAALVSIATALAAQQAEVPLDAVQATLHDRDGHLDLKVSTLLPRQIIEQCRLNPEGGLYELLTQKRHNIAARFEEMTARKVSKVDLAVTGVKQPEPEGRVK
ncbi:MAG: hypothetical protein Q4D87_07250 [Actinomycetaceae bacterium]|nr:hypothetical protein [Actinomycetaceae bacterium]